MPLAYVLVTPAHNEAALIERTIQSVIAQTLLPRRWIIVSDGSTDGTDDIVRRYQAGRPWLELVRLPPRTTRDFAAKVRAFNAGYEQLRSTAFVSPCLAPAAPGLRSNDLVQARWWRQGIRCCCSIAGAELHSVSHRQASR